MQIITTIAEMQEFSKKRSQEGKIIAVVPTMGFLHQGHASLVSQARSEADVVITTLFVNKLQFGANEDFSNYPRDFARDCNVAELAGSDILFAPDHAEMYPDDFSSRIVISGIADKFEGAFRRGHFDGMATVVAKLFGTSRPHIAYFGQKDYQQTLVVRRMVKDLSIDVKICVSPTIRESDGLAMSSRNVYLSPEERKKAAVLYRALQAVVLQASKGERRRKELNMIMTETLRTVEELMIDYACAANAENLDEPEIFDDNCPIVFLIAARLGAARLIDNELLLVGSEI